MGDPSRRRREDREWCCYTQHASTERGNGTRSSTTKSWRLFHIPEQEHGLGFWQSNRALVANVH